MSKAILLSIKPEWAAKILNETKTIEVRKLFPKDYVGWVYLYCSKDTSHSSFLAITHNLPGWHSGYCGFFYNELKDKHEYDGCYSELNGKVVARFWCDKVEEIYWTDITDDYDVDYIYKTNSLCKSELLHKSCLKFSQLDDYLNEENGFAIHISNLEIFDRPRELGEFLIKDNSRKPEKFVAGNSKWEEYYVKKLTKAPQNYCYIEIEIQRAFQFC